MFYGPGGGEYISWQEFQMVTANEQAIRAGVPESVIRDRLILQISEGSRLNFNGLTGAYAKRQVKRRIKAYTLLVTLQMGIPFVTRQVAWLRYQRVYAPLDAAAGGAVRRIAAKETAEAVVFRALLRRAPTRVLTRFIPYLGWGLAGYDIYTIAFKGSLWGVQIYEKTE